MSISIQFLPNGGWSGGNKIPKSLKEIDNLFQWAKNFIKVLKNLGRIYTQSYANDHQLLGQEKANMIHELEGLISGLLVFRKYLTENHPSQFHALDSKYKYRFSIKLTHDDWVGHGWFSNHYIFKISNFSDWYNNVLLNKLTQLIENYKTALADNVITETERTQLIVFVEVIIFNILVIEKALVSNSIANNN